MWNKDALREEKRRARSFATNVGSNGLFKYRIITKATTNECIKHNRKIERKKID